MRLTKKTLTYPETVFVLNSIFLRDSIWVPAGQYQARAFDNDRWLIWLNPKTCTLVNRKETNV